MTNKEKARAWAVTGVIVTLLCCISFLSDEILQRVVWSVLEIGQRFLEILIG